MMFFAHAICNSRVELEYKSHPIMIDRWSKAVDGQKLSIVESCRSMIKSGRLMPIDDQKLSINLSLIYDSFGVL